MSWKFFQFAFLEFGFFRLFDINAASLVDCIVQWMIAPPLTVNRQCFEEPWWRVTLIAFHVILQESKRVFALIGLFLFGNKKSWKLKPLYILIRRFVHLMNSLWYVCCGYNKKSVVHPVPLQVHNSLQEKPSRGVYTFSSTSYVLWMKWGKNS